VRGSEVGIRAFFKNAKGEDELRKVKSDLFYEKRRLSLLKSRSIRYEKI